MWRNLKPIRNFATLLLAFLKTRKANQLAKREERQLDLFRQNGII